MGRHDKSKRKAYKERRHKGLQQQLYVTTETSWSDQERPQKKIPAPIEMCQYIGDKESLMPKSSQPSFISKNSQTDLNCKDCGLPRSQNDCYCTPYDANCGMCSDPLYANFQRLNKVQSNYCNLKAKLLVSNLSRSGNKI